MSTENKTILFITCAFVSNSCWDDWKIYFENKGYTTLAPAWPYKDAPVDILKSRHPDYQVASIRLKELIAHFEAIATNIPGKLIV